MTIETVHEQKRWKSSRQPHTSLTAGVASESVINTGAEGNYTFEDSSNFSNLFVAESGTLNLVGVPPSVGINYLRAMIDSVRIKISRHVDHTLIPAIYRYDSTLSSHILSSDHQNALAVPLPAQALNKSYLRKLIRKSATPLLIFVASERTSAAAEYQKILMKELEDSYNIQALDLSDEMRNFDILQDAKKPKDKDEYELLFGSANVIQLRQIYSPDTSRDPVVVSVTIDQLVAYMLTVYKVRMPLRSASPCRIPDLVQSADSACLARDINIDVVALQAVIASSGRQKVSSRLSCLQRQLNRKVLRTGLLKSVSVVRKWPKSGKIDEN